jgi:SNF2 family DNA or RNA helicase
MVVHIIKNINVSYIIFYDLFKIENKIKYIKITSVKKLKAMNCDYDNTDDKAEDQSYYSNWIDVIQLQVKIKEIPLTKFYKKIETIPGLKTNLYQHQKTIIQAMYDLEQAESIQIVGKSVHSNAGVLSEPPGSGKTIDVLSLILLNGTLTKKAITRFNSRITNNKQKLTKAAVLIKTFKRSFKPTLIFVGPAVIKQWNAAIIKFTDLKYLCIYTVRDLRLFLTNLKNNKINEYDIILIKNGNITSMVKLPERYIVEPKNKKSTIPIYTIISNLRDVEWNRVVIDDFDTIKLPYDAGFINAKFTWYVSATKKTLKNRMSDSGKYFKVADMITYNNFNYHELLTNSLVFSSFNIANTPAYIKESSLIGTPNFYIHKFKNINEVYLNLINTVNGIDNNAIIEMLNSDSINTAAETLGISTTNVSDMFHKIIGDQYEQYRIAVTVLNFIETIEVDDLLPLQECEDKKTYGKSDLLNHREILYKFPNICAFLKETKIEYANIKSKSESAVARVRNNIKDGDCPICFEDFESNSMSMIVLKCCGVIICNKCCFRAVFKNKQIDGRCTHCRQPLNVKQIICITCDLDMTDVPENIGDVFDQEEKETEQTKKVKNDKKEEKKQSKLDVLLEITQGIWHSTKKNNFINQEVKLNSITTGNADLPESKIKKTLIFGMFDESIDEIFKLLKLNKITCHKLQGTPNQIHTIVNDFNNDSKETVLVINGIKYCSGLNIQNATDIVFLHRIVDRDIESQLIGRAQRLGRTSRLDIHYLLYGNEINSMKQLKILYN